MVLQYYFSIASLISTKPVFCSTSCIYRNLCAAIKNRKDQLYIGEAYMFMYGMHFMMLQCTSKTLAINGRSAQDMAVGRSTVSSWQTQTAVTIQARTVSSIWMPAPTIRLLYDFKSSLHIATKTSFEYSTKQTLVSTRQSIDSQLVCYHSGAI